MPQLRTAARAALVLTFLLPASAAHAATPVYQDTSRPFPERAADLVSRLTLEEKSGQLATTNAPAIPRLGVQEYAWWAEAQHGLWHASGSLSTYTARLLGTGNGIPATSFPTSLAASQSWDPELIRRNSTAISDEARALLDPSLYGTFYNNLGPRPGAYGSLSFWAPTVNMSRDPRWGRSDESFGEDPLLTGMLGSAWIEGFQGDRADDGQTQPYLKAIASAKHFALNNSEQDRMRTSSNADEATIREYYTPQYRAIVEQAGVGGMMTSYNAVNGVPAVANSFLMNGLARRTWGFDGGIVSDCGAVGGIYRDPAKTSGVPNTPIDVSGHGYAPPGWTWRPATAVSGASYVNDRTGQTMTGEALAEAISLRAGLDINCWGDPGEPQFLILASVLRAFTGAENGIEHLRTAIQGGMLDEGTIDRALVRLFTLRMRTGEFDPKDRQPYTRITKDELESPEHVALARDAVGRSVALLKNDVPAGAAAPVLPADPKRLRKVLVLGDLAGKVYLGGYSGDPKNVVSLADGLRSQIKAASPDADVQFEALGTATNRESGIWIPFWVRDAIRKADLVVMNVGTDKWNHDEGKDRKTIALAGSYRSLVDQVTAIGNPNTALVVTANGPVAIDDLVKKVPAIVSVPPGGQMIGAGLADVLLGRVNPSAKLSFTWYTGDAQLPAIENYGIAPGTTGGLGRTYQYLTGKPTFPFGHGLSYSRVSWLNAIADRTQIDANGTLRVYALVRNEGPRAGSDVVELYARSPQVAGREVPKRRLAGFARTPVLRPGEMAIVDIAVPIGERLRLWDAGGKRSFVPNGQWTFEVSRAAGQTVKTLPVQITGQLSTAVRRVTLQLPTPVLPPGASVDLRAEDRTFTGLDNQFTDPAAQRITAAVRDDDTFVDLRGQDVAFSSSDPEVATVDARGILTTRGPGTATITASYAGRTDAQPLTVR